MHHTHLEYWSIITIIIIFFSMTFSIMRSKSLSRVFVMSRVCFVTVSWGLWRRTVQKISTAWMSVVINHSVRFCCGSHWRKRAASGRASLTGTSLSVMESLTSLCLVVSVFESYICIWQATVISNCAFTPSLFGTVKHFSLVQFVFTVLYVLSEVSSLSRWTMVRVVTAEKTDLQWFAPQ